MHKKIDRHIYIRTYVYVTSTMSWCLGAETKGLQGTIMATPTNAHHHEDQKTQLPHTLTLRPLLF